MASGQDDPGTRLTGPDAQARLVEQILASAAERRTAVMQYVVPALVGAVTAVLTAFATFGGSWFSYDNRNRELDIKLFELAWGIYGSVSDNARVEEWAAGVLGRYSGVPFPPRREGQSESKAQTSEVARMAALTDVTLFPCAANADGFARGTGAALRADLLGTWRWGEIKLSGAVIGEAAGLSLGEVLVVFDAGHPERNDVPRLLDDLRAAPALAGAAIVRQAANTGDLTPWRLSVVVCVPARPPGGP